MLTTILNQLNILEQSFDIKILYACESGSRAWGFASPDSDYDVRFIYVHPMSWYLSIHEHKDTIERKIGEDLDFAGWDLKKTLGLLYKSNPPLLEWLNSPIVYLEDESIRQFRALAEQFYQPTTCIYHYVHMAKGNYQQYFKGDKVKLKKYLYVLRPLLCAKYIYLKNEISPTLFSDVHNQLDLDVDFRIKLNELIARKQAGLESEEVDKIGEFERFIQSELDFWAKAFLSGLKGNEVALTRVQIKSISDLDAYFRNTLLQQDTTRMEQSF